jgi:hypothetical protein
MGKAKLDVPKLASSYRRLVLWFGVQLVITIVGSFASFMTGETLLGVLISLAYLICIVGTIVALAIYAYRTAASLGSRVPFLWVVAMFIPLINAITLLVLSAKATRACRKAGIPVGFFGPKVAAKATLSQHKKKK